jgi:DNA-binding MarR family transcriptional regulator
MNRRTGLREDGAGTQTHERRAMEVLRQFRRVFGTVRRHFRAVEQACGLSGSHAWMLREIGRHPGLGLSDLASRLSIHASTASQLVEKLVRARLVLKSRRPEDQRRIGLRLTPRGEQVLAQAPEPAEGLLPGALIALPDRTLRSLHGGLAALLQEIGESSDSDAETPLSEL